VTPRRSCYYHIVVDNLISTISPTLSLNSCLNSGDPYFCSLIHRGTGGTLFATNDAFILSTNVNTGELQTDGIDVSSSYRLRLPTVLNRDIGGLDFGFSGTYVRKYWLKPLPTSTAAASYDCAGYYEYHCGAPRPKWRHNFETTWETPWNFSLSTTWRYISHVELSRASTQPALIGTYAPIDKYLGAISYIDMSAAYRLGQDGDFARGRQQPARQGPSVVNRGEQHFGRQPEHYPQFYDTLGRVIFGTVAVQF
jgi:iron complex outermembrane receptor protein